MSKKAALLVYQNLNSIEEDNSYWEKYIKFHELYWDGPNASQNVFYGREYEEYRDSLSKYLEIEPEQIKDCLFTKSLVFASIKDLSFKERASAGSINLTLEGNISLIKLVMRG